jgi:hypothetical protein
LTDIEVDTVYGFSKHLEKVIRAPASGSMVTVERIKQYECRALTSVLGSI